MKAAVREARAQTRRHAQPRDSSGHYQKGMHLWTRLDGPSRWVRWPDEVDGPPPETDIDRLWWLSDQAAWLLRWIALLVVIGLIAAVWPR